MHFFFEPCLSARIRRRRRGRGRGYGFAMPLGQSHRPGETLGIYERGDYVRSCSRRATRLCAGAAEGDFPRRSFSESIRVPAVGCAVQAGRRRCTCTQLGGASLSLHFVYVWHCVQRSHSGQARELILSPRLLRSADDGALRDVSGARKLVAEPSGLSREKGRRACLQLSVPDSRSGLFVRGILARGRILHRHVRRRCGTDSTAFAGGNTEESVVGVEWQGHIESDNGGDETGKHVG